MDFNIESSKISCEATPKRIRLECTPWIKKHPRTTRGWFVGLREGGSTDGETKGRENGGDGGQSDVDDDAPLVFRILSHSFLLMML